jgi:hypothetical protein
MISEFFSGSLNPAWPHAILLVTAIVASFSVAAGIVLENPKWSLANVLVVGGVAIEAICTLLLFGFDEGMSQVQQRRIEQMLAHRVLTTGQIDRLAAVTKRFPSLNVGTVTVPEAEPWDFAMNIAAVLEKGGWNWIPCVNPDRTGLKPLAPDPRPSSCTSILDHIEVQTSDEMKPVRDALISALRDESVIGMTDARPSTNNVLQKNILIMVGSKL